MKLLLAGCEYSGTTTIAHAFNDWMEANTGARIRLIHDHFKMPHIYGHPPEVSDEEQSQILGLSPWIKDKWGIQRGPPASREPDLPMMIRRSTPSPSSPTDGS